MTGSSLAQEIEISRANFCLGIKDREPIDAVTERAPLPPQSELFFWIEFQGGKATLQALEDKNQLLVKHQWRKGILVTDTIEVGITIDKWHEYRDAIRMQVKEKGFFTFRTYSYKKNWEYGSTYTVITLDSNDNAVCEVGSRVDFRPKILVVEK
jgi:hypothetical protein